MPDDEGDAATAPMRNAFQCDALAQQAIESFYEAHGDHWVLDVTKTGPGDALRPKEGCSPDSSELVLSHESEDLDFELRFPCVELDGTGVEELNNAGPILTLNQLPTGLAIAGCPVDFDALAPSNREHDAVEIVSIYDGRIVLRVRMRLFSVQGWNHDQDACRYMPDAPALAQCYASVRKDIMLDATFDLPTELPF